MYGFLKAFEKPQVALALILLGSSLSLRAQFKPASADYCSAETVTSAAKQNRMPKVLGCRGSAVVEQLRAAHRFAELATSPSPRPAGEIISQSPKPNADIRTNGRIRLTVSDGSQKQGGENNGQHGDIETPQRHQDSHHWYLGTLPEIHIPEKNTDPKKPQQVSADVSVSNTLLGNAPFHRDGKVVYRIVVNNNGPSRATGIDLYLRQPIWTLLAFRAAAARRNAGWANSNPVPTRQSTSRRQSLPMGRSDSKRS